MRKIFLWLLLVCSGMKGQIVTDVNFGSLTGGEFVRAGVEFKNTIK
jgi:hypothetical protein